MQIFFFIVGIPIPAVAPDLERFPLFSLEILKIYCQFLKKLLTLIN